MPESIPAVYGAIAAVQAALAKQGIAKARKNQQQGYAFRGIDDVYSALAPLLAEHGLCIIPRVLSRTCTERQTWLRRIARPAGDFILALALVGAFLALCATLEG